MSPLLYTYQYNKENLLSFSWSLEWNTLIIIAGIFAIYALVYFLAPHIYSNFVYREREKEKQAKRNVIKDLILMKEIQTELEKEIEQSLLNAWMQKGV